MDAQRFLTTVLLLGLLTTSGHSVTYTHAGPPSATGTPGEDSALAVSPVSGLADPDWWGTVQEDIRRSEYHVTWQARTRLADLPAAYQAPNRAHNLRTYFAPAGVRVIRRTETPSPWQWGLGLTGYRASPTDDGAEHVQPVAAAELTAAGNRIEYRRDGDLAEWYINDERGLEQVFAINHQPPTVGGQPAQVVLDLALTGDLIPTLTVDGQAVEFATASGVPVLRYGDLRATDAAGHTLPAHLSLSAVRAALHVVVDARATYPIQVQARITGLPATADWTAESNQVKAYFGCSVGTAGDVNGDDYSDVVVGADSYDNGQTDEGRVYVYHGSASGLSATAAWTAESNQGWILFGHSVGTAGDVNGDGYADVVVGAFYYSNGQTYEGRAYVYHGSASGLSATPNWTAEGNQSHAFFGTPVGTAGDVNGDGYADVIVGAYGYTNGESGEGRTYVYHGSASGLSATPDWTAESNQVGAFFGRAVGTAGDVNGDGYSDVIVGALYYDGGETDEGRAYVYLGTPSGLRTTPGWTAEGNQYVAQFGCAVGTAGDVNGDGYSDVIVGAPLYDGVVTDEGQARVYHGSPAGLEPHPNWIIEGNQYAAWFGYSVGTAGDVNGDGYADVVVGAVQYTNGQPEVRSGLRLPRLSRWPELQPRLASRGRSRLCPVWLLGGHSRRRERRWLC